MFVGTLDYFHEPATGSEGPSVQFVPHDGGAYFYANLGINPQHGFRTVPDDNPHVRRLIFAVSLPDNHEKYNVTIALSSGDPGLGRTEKHIKVGVLFREGRYWNAIPAAPALAAENDNQGHGRRRFLFVGGAQKSGTTWVQMLLNSHPHIFCTGEGNFFGLVRDLHIQAHNEWLPPMAPDTYCFELANVAVWKFMADFYGEVTGCDVIADKSPGNAAEYAKILDMWPSAKVIHCRRHPLDVLVSRLHHEIKLSREGGVSDAPQFAAEISQLAIALQDTAVRPLPMKDKWTAFYEYVIQEWIDTEETVAKLVTNDADRIFIAGYEDLLTNTSEVVRRMFEFSGVSHDTSVVQRVTDACSFTRITGRQRGEEDESSFFRAGASGQYARYFSRSVISWAEDLVRRSSTAPR